ncbi:TPA: methyltransferase domain-containing protein [Candidatus Bipolaricaulota bacterium]|nr:methyltransferase domain-containing protein [Candidatus Bipolaricaulota bacterium]
MKGQLCELLVCPACHGELSWRVNERNGDHIEEGEARCAGCGAAYPVREGIGVFLTPDLPRHDLWEGAESGLVAYLREHPGVERALLKTPLEELSPADRFFRALLLEERGEFAGARQAEEAALVGLYTPEYRSCWRRQVEYVLGRLSPVEGPVIDLASGRGYLAEELAQKLESHIVLTDFSPRVLRRNRRYFEFLGLPGRVSLIACDARRMPFRAGAVVTMTTNLGLANIQEPGELVGELRRVIAGEFLAICHFFPEDDAQNAEVIRKFGLEAFLFGDSTRERFSRAGFRVELVNVCRSQALPTPHGELIQGAGIDALPVAETELTWCTLVAR